MKRVIVRILLLSAVFLSFNSAFSASTAKADGPPWCPVGSPFCLVVTK